MSESGSSGPNPFSSAQYSTECRNDECDHDVQALIPMGAVKHNVNGVRVRCRECRTTNFIEREDPGNE